MARSQHGPGSLRWLITGFLCLAFCTAAVPARAAVVAADFDQDGVTDHLLVLCNRAGGHDPITTRARLRAWLEYGERGFSYLPARVRAHIRIRGFQARTGAVAWPRRAAGRQKAPAAKGPVKRRQRHHRSRDPHDLGRDTHGSSSPTNQAAPTGSDGVGPPRRLDADSGASGMARASSDSLPSFAPSARRASRAPPDLSV